MNTLVAIVGRPNVGKSSLFNRLIGEKKALVANIPGVTRDRLFGVVNTETQSYTLIDTGGIGETTDDLEQFVSKQSFQAIDDAQLIYFVVDAKQGMTPADQHIARQLRKTSKPIILIVNKIDAADEAQCISEFCHLFEHVLFVSVTQNRGVVALNELTLELLPQQQAEQEEAPTEGPVVALIGRPNVGKSTLINQLLGEERVIACDQPGVTRDSVYIPFVKAGKPYTLVDTCGMRKKGRIIEGLEHYSVAQSLRAVQNANVVLVLFDAKEGITDQDLALVDYAIEMGRSCILLANKWDAIDSHERKRFETSITYRLKFADYLPIQFISAQKGLGLQALFRMVDKVYQSAKIEPSTHRISDILERATASHPPPTVRGRRIRLKHAHLGGNCPPTIIVHGNQTKDLPASYVKYLVRAYIDALKLVGTPVRIILKSPDNPYKDKRNTLTPRQLYKKKRMMKHVK